MNKPHFPGYQPAHQLSRRQLLQAIGVGAFSLGLPGLVSASVAAERKPASSFSYTNRKKTRIPGRTTSHGNHH